jgi:hypothetical protein
MYRCLKSNGFQTVLFNASINGKLLRCGLAKFSGHLGPTIKLKDIDNPQFEIRLIVPEPLRDRPSYNWLHSSSDNLEFEITDP